MLFLTVSPHSLFFLYSAGAYTNFPFALLCFLYQSCLPVYVGGADGTCDNKKQNYPIRRQVYRQDIYIR